MSSFNDYQAAAGLTNKGTTLVKMYDDGSVGATATGMYNALGLCGEAGECAEKIKKYARDGGIWDDVRNSMQLELGDVLWYVSQLARDWGLTLQQVADANLEKLASRKARNVLSGSGDNR